MSRKEFIMAVPILILLFASFAQSQDDWSVTVEINQKNKAAKPFDVFGDLNYNVIINNNGLSDQSYIIELAVGPDTRNKAIKKDFQTRFPHLKVNFRSSNKAVFTVNFAEFEGSDEFLQWMADKNRTDEWKEAWYKLSVKPFPFGEGKEMAELRESPTLVKPFFEYREGSSKVVPAQGNAATPFNYEVTIYGSYRDNVTLEVSSDLVSGWKSLESRYYDTPNAEKTLAWKNQTLGFDFNSASYRFCAIRPSGTFDGPFWPVAVEWRNSSLHPIRGLSNTPFSYRLEVNASKPIEVGLYVRDVLNGLYNLVERRSYSNISSWQLLNWTGVTPSNTPGAEGASSYYFGFFYPGKAAPFLTTYDRERRFYPGPDIVQVIFKNQSVSPENGSVLVPYSYAVEIETSLSKALLQLKTSDPGSDEWDLRREILYDSSKSNLSWKDVMLGGKIDGMARYRFVCGRSESDVYYGPNIGSIKLNSTVSPRNGSLYIIDKPGSDIERIYSFNFTAEVTGLQQKQAVVTLEIYDPEARSWISACSQEWNPGQRWLNYSMNFAKIPFLRPFLGGTRYRYTSGGRELGKAEGPNILVNLKNESLQKLTNGSFIYRVMVRSTLSPLAVYILYTDDGKTWQRYSEKQVYNSAGQWQELVWTARKFQKVEFIADVEA